MPELPEVETCRSGIAPHLVKQQIAAIEIRTPRLRWPVPELHGLIGQQILSVERRGKYLKLVCSAGYILIHLGMSGSLRILQESQQPGKHDHIDLVTATGLILRYNDPRRFGCWLFHNNPHTDHPLLAELGPEPLTESFNATYLYQLSRKKSAPIKSLIMDSHVVVGVGNIYACESLFKAGINPKRAAGKVTQEKTGRLVAAIKGVLAAAISQGGTTLRDFTDSNGKPGYFKQQLLVYGRQGEPCYNCGHSIKNVRIGQRSSFFCPHCQK